MTEGIPAKISMALLRTEENVPLVKYSPKNIEMEREKGIEIKRAKKEVKRVPTRKGSAPNRLNTGSQVFPKRKPIPNSLIEGIECTRSDKKIAKIRATRRKAER